MSSARIAILLLVGTTLAVYAQHEPEGDKKAAKQEKSEPLPPQRTQEQAQTWQQQRGWIKSGGWTPRNTFDQGRAQRWSTEHRTWVQRGGYGGAYIPQDRFNLSFGNQHSFRLTAVPVMYLGYPRFEYSGVSFLLVDPWPEYWSSNWYSVNDLYIDYNDGYYLHNRTYSQVSLAITVVQ
jgi:hypothetical protein